MIDLQIKFSEALNKEEISLLADQQHIDLVADYENNPSFVKSLLQDVEPLEEAMYLFSSRLAKNNYIYVEILFEIGLYTNIYMSSERVINAALRGLYKTLKEYPEFDANILFICDTANEVKKNNSIVRLALDYKKDNKVAGIYFINNSSQPFYEKQKECFLYIKKNALPVTIEVNDLQQLEEAINADINRLAINFNIEINKQLAYQIYTHRLTLIYSPDKLITSGAAEDYFHLTNRQASILGVDVTISDKDVAKEYKNLLEKQFLRREDIYLYLLKSINACFADEDSKGVLITRLVNKFNQFYLSIKED